MSTTVEDSVKTVRLVGFDKISVPRTEKFVGFDVYAPDGSGPAVVIKPSVLPSSGAVLRLGEVMPTARYWADRWRLEAVQSQTTAVEPVSCMAFANEYVDGVSLTEFVKQTGPLPLTRVLTLVAALDAAQATAPEAAAHLTPDRVMFTASGAPKFLVRDGYGVGPAGCIWFALTGQAPPRPRLSISLLRDDLPRALRVVVDAVMAGHKDLSDLCTILQRFAAPEPMQLGLAQVSRQRPGNGSRIRETGLRGLVGRIIVSLFTSASVLLAGWQLQQRFAPAESAESKPSVSRTLPAGYGWDARICLWDRLAASRQSALAGSGTVTSYTFPGSAAERAERALQAKLKAAGIEFSGLQLRLVPGQYDGRECIDPVGLLDWLPVTSGVAEQEQQVYSLISAHRQRDGAGVERTIKPVKQQLSVRLSLHRGRWLISSIAIADGHAQSLAKES